MSEVEKIAAGLTKAQREAVVNARKSFGMLSLHGAPSTLHSLKRKGITSGRFADRFTDPLGLATRRPPTQGRPRTMTEQPESAVEAMREACIAAVMAEKKYEASDFPVCNSIVNAIRAIPVATQPSQKGREG